MKKILIAGLLGITALVPQIASANGYYYGGYGYHDYHHVNPWPYVAGALAVGVVAGAVYDHPRTVVEYPQPVYNYAPPPAVYVAPAPQPYSCTYYPDGSRYCN